MNIKSVFLYLLLIFLLTTDYAVNAQQSSVAIVDSRAPADASVAYSSYWTMFHNPAVLAFEKDVCVGIAYQNRFAMKELSSGSAYAGVPTKFMHVGLGVSHFGYSQYSESQIGLAFSKQFNPRFSIGMQIDYYAVCLSPEEGYASNAVVQVGILSEVMKNLFVGFHAYNPSQTNIKVGETQKRIPSVFSLGTSYFFSQDLLFLCQLDKEVEYDLRWKTGFEYSVLQQLSMRLGVAGNPLLPSLGLGYKNKKVCLDVDFQRHPTLGLNSVCNLRFVF